jgi:hypothetical protein
VVEVEDVLGIEAILQCGQPGHLLRAVCSLNAGLALIAKGVDVDAAGERFDGGAVYHRAAVSRASSSAGLVHFAAATNSTSASRWLNAVWSFPMDAIAPP